MRERWKDPKNARAAVVFVLSGGNARVLQKLIAQRGMVRTSAKSCSRAPWPTARGGTKRPRSCWQASRRARSIPAWQGIVAYVQGELAAKKEPAKALAYLDDARLLSPGTIIEEAALRRQIALLAAAGKADRYELLATQYLRRFSKLGLRRRFPPAVCRGDRGRIRMPASRAGLRAWKACSAAWSRRIGARCISRSPRRPSPRARWRWRGSPPHMRGAGGGQQRRAGARAALRGRGPDRHRGIRSRRGDAGRRRARPSWPTPDAALLDAALAIAGQVRRLPDPPDSERRRPGRGKWRQARCWRKHARPSRRWTRS